MKEAPTCTGLMQSIAKAAPNGRTPSLLVATIAAAFTLGVDIGEETIARGADASRSNVVGAVGPRLTREMEEIFRAIVNEVTRTGRSGLSPDKFAKLSDESRKLVANCPGRNSVQTPVSGREQAGWATYPSYKSLCFLDKSANR